MRPWDEAKTTFHRWKSAPNLSSNTMRKDGCVNQRQNERNPSVFVFHKGVIMSTRQKGKLKTSQATSGLSESTGFGCEFSNTHSNMVVMFERGKKRREEIPWFQLKMTLYHKIFLPRGNKKKNGFHYTLNTRTLHLGALFLPEDVRMREKKSILFLEFKYFFPWDRWEVFFEDKGEYFFLR